MAPADGERRLISAITCIPGSASAAAKLLPAGSASAAARNWGRWGLKAAMRCLVE